MDTAKQSLGMRILNHFYKSQVYFYIVIIVTCCVMIGFTESSSPAMINPLEERPIEIQGHRGARGLYPENTIEGFIKAIDLGVNTLEMDVVISKDHQVVVSHEPWMSHKICSQPNGDEINKAQEDEHLIFAMNYDELQQYDCGSRGNTKFPEQIKTPATKPLLSDVIEQVEQYVEEKGLESINYNIETKSRKAWDNDKTPEPKLFIELVYNVVKDAGVINKTCIQSFDVRTLQELKQLDETITTALLIDNINSVEKNVEELGYTPEVYSPYHVMVTSKMIEKVHEHGMKIIPWTVNDKDKMQALANKGVDGIITDYPDRAAFLMAGK